MSDIERTIKAQIDWITHLEEEQFIEITRDAADYCGLLKGYAHFLARAQEIATQHSAPYIVDIGTGISKAASQIQTVLAESGHTLEMYGTGLVANPSIERYLGKDKVLLTPVEVMAGFSPHSIAAILSVHGLAYSSAPKISVDKLDSILVPNGIIKSTFQHPLFFDRQLRMFSHERFLEAWQELGYGVAIEEDIEHESVIVIAVKDSDDDDARKLLEADLQTHDEQLTYLTEKFSDSQ